LKAYVQLWWKQRIQNTVEYMTPMKTCFLLPSYKIDDEFHCKIYIHEETCFDKIKNYSQIFCYSVIKLKNIPLQYTLIGGRDFFRKTLALWKFSKETNSLMEGRLMRLMGLRLEF
jgi:hypothetical protein